MGGGAWSSLGREQAANPKRRKEHNANETNQISPRLGRSRVVNVERSLVSQDSRIVTERGAPRRSCES